jgi:hypothetical protein
MDVKEFVKQYLNCIELVDVNNKNLVSQAKDLGFVIVTPYSDDSVMLSGALRDQGGCYDGGKLRLAENGFIDDVDEDGELESPPETIEECRRLLARWDASVEFEVIYNKRPSDGVFTWQYVFPFPHETFMILDDGDPYAQGAVFSLDALKTAISNLQQ